MTLKRRMCLTTSHFEHFYTHIHTHTSEYYFRRMTEIYERVPIGFLYADGVVNVNKVDDLPVMSCITILRFYYCTVGKLRHLRHLGYFISMQTPQGVF